MNEHLSEFYANAVNVSSSIYDVTLSFRTQSPVYTGGGDTPIIEVTESFSVRMSPQHAKALAALLVEQIVNYERRHGTKLVVPSEIAGKWQALIAQT